MCRFSTLHTSSTAVPQGAQDPAQDWVQMLRQPVLTIISVALSHWQTWNYPSLDVCLTGFGGVWFCSALSNVQLSSKVTRWNSCPAWSRPVLTFNVFWPGSSGTFAYYQLLKFLFSFPPNKYFSEANTKSYIVQHLWNVHLIFKQAASRRAAYL